MLTHSAEGGENAGLCVIYSQNSTWSAEVAGGKKGGHRESSPRVLRAPSLAHEAWLIEVQIPSELLSGAALLRSSLASALIDPASTVPQCLTGWLRRRCTRKMSMADRVSTPSRRRSPDLWDSRMSPPAASISTTTSRPSSATRCRESPGRPSWPRSRSSLGREISNSKLATESLSTMLKIPLVRFQCSRRELFWLKIL